MMGDKAVACKLCQDFLNAYIQGFFAEFSQRAREKTPGGQVVLRVRGSTGSLGKLTLQRDCGVSWRYQRYHELPQERTPLPDYL
jgi:hypothetical protein